MKNIKFLFTAMVASAMMFVGCEKDDDNSSNNNQNNNNQNTETGIQFTESANSLTATFISYDEDLNTNVDARIDVEFDSKGKAISAILYGTYPTEELARQAYNLILADLNEEDDPSNYSISGKTISMNMSELFVGKSKAEVRATIQYIFSDEDDDEDDVD